MAKGARKKAAARMAKAAENGDEPPANSKAARRAAKAAADNVPDAADTPKKKWADEEDYSSEGGEDEQLGGDGAYAAPKLRIEDLNRKNERKSRAKFAIKLEEVDLQLGSSKLLEHASLTLSHGRRYGVVAPNGLGKSSLLKAVAERQFDGIPKELSVMYVEQEAEASEMSALDFVVEADKERLALFAELERLEERDREAAAAAERGDDNPELELTEADVQRLEDVRMELHQSGAYTARKRAQAILSGLQFTPDMQARAVRDFSGGWRMRISLARGLFVRPDVLLLDEPTNHLDLFAAVWLEEFLSRWKRTLVMVSHDVALLDYVCTDIVHIWCRKLYTYRGNYEHFLQGFDERCRAYSKQYDKQQKELKRVKDLKNETQSAGGGGGGKKKAKGQQAGGGGGRDKGGAAARKHFEQAQRELEKKELLLPPPKPYNPKFAFKDPGKLPYPVIQVKEASFRYPSDSDTPNPFIFKRLDFGIDLDSRIALVGKNGVGKSTLLKVICGDVEPTDGEVIINPKLRIGRFNQHFVDQLDMTVTPVQYLAHKFGVNEGEARRALGHYGLTGDHHVTRISELSGGQKSRVVFTALHFEQPHILFLDEPTNHLDIESVRALIDAIRDFPGGVVLITHNQRLIKEACNRIWVIEDNKCTEFDGEFKDYYKSLLVEIQDLLFNDDDDDNDE